MNKTQEMNRKIALNLKNERKKANLSQEEVAEIIGVTRETIISYEKGRKISASLIAELSKLYQCPVDNFYLGLDVTNC